MRLFCSLALVGAAFLAGCVSLVANEASRNVGVAGDSPRGSGLRRLIAGSPEEIEQALHKTDQPGFVLSDGKGSVRMVYDKVGEGDRVRLVWKYSWSPGPAPGRTEVEAILESSTGSAEILAEAETTALDELAYAVARGRRDAQTRRQPPAFQYAVAVAPVQDGTPATYIPFDDDTNVPSFTRDPDKQASYGADAMAAYMARDLADSGLFISAAPAGAGAADLLIEPTYLRADSQAFAINVKVLQGEKPLLTKIYECTGPCGGMHAVLVMLDSLRQDLQAVLASDR